VSFDPNRKWSDLPHPHIIEGAICKTCSGYGTTCEPDAFCGQCESCGGTGKEAAE
jgi:hypothetical protein